jgi:acetyl-CoA C-acetyltransferase
MAEAGAELDGRTPVLIGVGEASDPISGPDYLGLSAVGLAAAAAQEALADSGVDPAAVAATIDTVAAIRQFENSTPGAVAPLGRSDNFPRSVAARIGADPRDAILEVSGGQSPQHMVNEMAAAIAAGEREAVLLCGAEAISTARHLADADERPDFTEQVEGTLEDRGFGLAGMITRYQLLHDLIAAPEQYALLENARRARLGASREAYAREMGDLFAPFTKVAADNPHAAAPVERSAEELITPSERNRPIADPYPRFLVARDQVNQGASVLLTSLATARRLGVSESRLVFLHGHADLVEPAVLDRRDLGAAPATGMAIRHALALAGVGIDELATIDLYSCFPIAVLSVCDELGLAADDPRGLTVTGGLPFFGGAGNDYSMHAIATTVRRVRETPGAFGLVGANGGILSKYSVGVYSTSPAGWKADDSAALQAKIDAWEAPALALRADGWGTIETWTVKHTRRGSRGIVVGRLEQGGERFLALVVDGDREMLDLLASEEVAGRRVFVGSYGYGNRVALDEERLARLIPPPPTDLRESYEHIQVRRDGHLLEVTIDRPESRNSLHPPANAELEEVFDAFFADPELWVAILVGDGTKAFSAGNDLAYLASGKPVWVPKSGFAGLTSRAGMTKPVIAAVNGFAMGGGFEIALACHLFVADERATFALPEVKVGLVPGAGGAARLPRVIPEKIAAELVLTGRRLDVEEARALGLVNRVVEPGTALEGARALAREILSSSPTSVRIALRLMNEARAIPDPVAAADPDPAAIDELLLSEDMAEGIAAFAAKREPRWKNR